MRTGSSRVWALVLCLLALLVMVPACGGGGGPSEPPPPPPQPPMPPPPPPQPDPSVRFFPDADAEAQSLRLSRLPASSTESVLVLRLRAEEVEDLYGYSADLVFPSDLLGFVLAEDSGFLGGQATLQVVESEPGRLVIGGSRLGAIAGRDGSGPLVDLTFESLATGEGRIDFEAQEVVDSLGNGVETTWIGGTVETQL